MCIRDSYYEGEEISYVVGDASNAYGKVVSPLWLERGRLSGTQYTLEKGWDENKLDFFRRHTVQLGRSGLFVVYDELVAKEPVEWNYLLHTVELPMEVAEEKDGLRILGKNKADGVYIAHLFLSVSYTHLYVTMTNEYNKEGEFLTFVGYEAHSMEHGDHVALNYDLDAPLVECTDRKSVV